MYRGKYVWFVATSLAISLLALALTATPAHAVAVTVTDPAGNPVSGFRWIIEEDNTLQTPPQQTVNPSIGIANHKSHAPVIASGEENSALVSVPIPAPYNQGRVMVSVLPYTGYQMSGKSIDAASGALHTIVVNPLPIPTAQISVLVFNDNNPINNVADQGELGLAGFKVSVDDTAGQISLDVFGNPLGTTYQIGPDGQPILVGGEPQVQTVGPGYVLTGADGQALVKYLAPGKYGVNIVPPSDQPGWLQTATIEGTPTVDAWVKADEPAVFTEGFGTGFNHVFFGFVNPDQLPYGEIAGGTPGAKGEIPPEAQANLIGTISSNHFSAPPTLQGFFKGVPVDQCYVGLNDAATRQGLIVVPCTENASGDAEFSISGIPAGTYQLVTFDKPLITLFTITTIIVHPGTNVVGPADPDTGTPPPAQASLDFLIFRWFGNLDGSVFFDTNQDGFPDPGEPGIREQVINIRYRDGSIYQTQVTDPLGNYEFATVFPFFKWLVVEGDFARFKPTGMTTVVDAGGQIPVTDPTWVADGRRNPQIQADGKQWRTETGTILTQAMHLFLGQFNRIDWGKTAYGPNESGGISGLVVNDLTRANDDPRQEVQDFLDTGIPRAQVNLYTDVNGDKVIDDKNGDGVATLADVDNYPLGWESSPFLKGPEDVDRNANGIFDAGDAVQIARTDSFDDTPPADCIWTGRTKPVIAGQPVQDCFDNFANWNQVVPGVFDGGWAFTDYYPNGIVNGGTPMPLPGAQHYIVESPPPHGYVLQKEEDKNVDFGESYVPSTQAQTPECVGDVRPVPDYTSFQTVAGAGLQALPGVDPADLVAAPFAGESRPLCDKKWVLLTSGANAPVEFHHFTHVPKAARAVGFVNNDLGAEFDATSPIYGEKPAPKWIPISFRDWAGREVSRIYSDEWGAYNSLLPSNFTSNLPTPLGNGYQMYTLFLNHPFMTTSTGATVPDPNYNPNYSQMAWTFQYSGGKTSYLDTPILPVAAFVGSPDFGVDVSPANLTPVIESVSGENGVGPLLRADGDNLVLTSRGISLVPNPAYSSLTPNVPKTISRDYGFGSGGTVTLNGVPLSIVYWTPSTIYVRAPTGSISGNQLQTGQLVVTRSDSGLSSELSVTVHVIALTDPTPIVYVDAAQGQTIQAAIDAPTTTDGSLILVKPGFYPESVIVYKNVRLQGYGGHSTQIYPYPQPLDTLATWHAKVQALIAAGEMKNLGDQLFFRPIERPGFLVLVNDARILLPTIGKRQIDGFYVNGSIAGGGIQVPDLGDNLAISNNTITGNQGTVGGAVVVGNLNGPAVNPNVQIRNNWLLSNSSRGNGGGAISLFEGASTYQVKNNRIAGNLSTWYGGGILHFGESDGGLIQGNKILVNEVFFGAQVGGDGGGIYIAGEPAALGGLAAGAGSVTIAGNLIQGNLAGSGAGGGIRVDAFNGTDTQTPGITNWWHLQILSNIIVNNVAAMYGSGISLKEVARAGLLHNTITANDTTSTARAAFPVGAAQSVPNGAGLVSEVNSTPLATNTGVVYPNPVLVNNVLAFNRSFYMDTTLNNGSGGLVYEAYKDMRIIGDTGTLTPVNCMLTDASGFPGNLPATNLNPVLFYHNSLLFSVVIDEGGNNISARFSPLSQFAGNYHLTTTSGALAQGANVNYFDYPLLVSDIDGSPRPATTPDIGADQFLAAVTPCPGDLDGNRRIDLKDLRILRNEFGCTGACQADLNQDGLVNQTDYTILTGVMGTQCP
jgi:hypothetical protein